MVQELDGLAKWAWTIFMSLFVMFLKRLWMSGLEEERLCLECNFSGMPKLTASLISPSTMMSQISDA